MMPEYPEPELMPGGIGKSQPADPEVQALCDSVKSEVEAQRGEKYETFKAISYKKQTVYGYNYFVKVHVGGNKHLELFLYVMPSPNSRPDLRGVKDFTDDQISDLRQEIRRPVRPRGPVLGGIGRPQRADPGVQAICDSVKRDVEEKRGEKYETFEAISYRTQTVAGCNYFVKVHVGQNKHLELVVFVGLPHTNSGPVLRSVHESTDDQISDLDREGMRVIPPEPFICHRPRRQEMMMPENPRVFRCGGVGGPQGMRFRGPEPFICHRPRQPQMMMPESPKELICGGVREPQSMRFRTLEPFRPRQYGCGGIGESQPADPEVQALCDSVKSEVEARRGEKYETFKAISYKQQTVKGYNYFVKVHVGGNKHLELFLYVMPFPNSRPDLRGVKDFTDDQISDLRQEIRRPVRPRGPVLGGIGRPQRADPGVQAICDSVKRDVEEKRGEKYETFEAISYRTQTVAGCNYFVKVHVGHNKHLELKVHVEPPPNSKPKLRWVQDLEPIRPQLIVGGIGESQPADPEVQAICNSVKRDVEKKRGEKYETFEAISYRTQVVAGTNYTVKVHIGQNKHLELVVFVGLPHTNSGPVLRRVLELAK
ncbi:uncharacterized protein LOC110159253 isoform X2 [Boleophthalmus pectinirostris]|uniref:uncharacterized protein LOC110159253 isoform X2 n=1 Tax=Boleophthalmus pectinirostris TaxID=150288 RepID=UPI002432BF01|nr:uncharacterized protein LOC110159253 isoform X2 [Boleophthalmus pectinirostris]